MVCRYHIADKKQLHRQPSYHKTAGEAGWLWVAYCEKLSALVK